MSPEVIYRQADMGDIEKLPPFLKTLFSVETDFHYSADIQLRGLKMLLESDNGTIIIALIQGIPEGMVTGQLTISTAEGAPSLLVEDLVVNKSFQGLGIGKGLLQTIGTWGSSRGAARMQLLADRKNQSAIDFYIHNNWKLTDLICLRNYHTEN